MDKKEKDELWQVALYYYDGEGARRGDDDEASLLDDDDDDACNKWISYKLPSKPPITLQLAGLPSSDGVWSPLGAHAWYGSALLTALLFQENNRIHEHLQRFNYESITALELGSGAVGLAGMALAWLLSSPYHRSNQVILTDNEPALIQQLERNAQRTLDVMAKQATTSSTQTTQIRVCKLDWHDQDDNILQDSSSPIQLVIGSELVYTPDTGKACARLVQNLLNVHPQALVVIVQITDRDGWETVFLPELKCNVVQEERLTDPELHEIAGQLVPNGGTLNARYDFGVAYISRIEKQESDSARQG